MSDLLSSEIKLIGEKLVKQSLVEDNFSNVQVEAADDDFNYVVADGVTIKIMVRIITTLSSAERQQLSNQDKAQLISYAILQNRIAYQASVVVNADGTPNGEIEWYKLS